MKNFQIPDWVKNKYFLVITFSLVWMLFFDRYDIFYQMKLRNKIQSLENDKKFYKEEIKRIKQDRILLVSDEDHLETFARERYWMKKPDEDLYIIIPEK